MLIPQKGHRLHLRLTPYPPCPAPDTTDPPSASVDWPVLDASYQWTYPRCVVLCLASLTEHSVFKVHPRAQASQCEILIRPGQGFLRQRHCFQAPVTCSPLCRSGRQALGRLTARRFALQDL